MFKKKYILVFLITFVFSLNLFIKDSISKDSLDNKKILEIIMKERYYLKNDIAIHKPNKYITKKYPDLYSEIYDFETKIVLKYPFYENKLEKVLIITQSDIKDSSCHVCSPVVGMVILVKNKDTWDIEGSYDYTEKIGTFGSIPIPKIYENKNKNKLIVFEDSYSGMGTTTKRVYIISKVKNQFKQVFYDDETYYDNLGMCGNVTKTKCVCLSSKFDFIKNDKEFQDINVKKFGTIFDNNGKIKKVNEVRKYFFDSKNYKLFKN